MEETVVPLAQLSTSTDSESRLGSTSGNDSLPWVTSWRKFLAKRVRWCASQWKSTCFWRIPANSSCEKGIVRSGNLSINLKMSSTSTQISSRTEGCRTLTATSRIVLPWAVWTACSGLNRPLCTWATVPEATGSMSNSSNSSSSSTPKDSKIMARVCSNECGGTSLRSLERALIMSGANMSGRIDNHWPNFWKEQPAFSSVFTRTVRKRSRQSGLSETDMMADKAAQGVKMTMR
mmetsp:Transcript_19324/g.46172  ORF Transcript_19324/g.46172 Transcript_19324/m.46172 type:complete len:234 (+) Transcript_19324:1755-2456(+)